MNGKGVAAVVMVICWIGAGCSDKNNVPGGVLPVEKMTQVMWDMAQADQLAAMNAAKDSTHGVRKEETMRLYEEVFRLHDVTREEFRKSYQYYLDHPALNQTLFDSVMARGTRARTELYDRPSASHPTAAPRPGVISPVVPGKPGAASTVVRGKGGMASQVVPGRPGAIVPGIPAGPAGDAIRRARERMARRQDSLSRATHGKRDTTRGKP